MNISELSIKRPVLATVLNIGIILFGVVGYSFLALREYPAIDPPIVTVRTNYTGANADIIASQITEPLEKSINGIQGIKTISSSSNNGSSSISIEFNLEVNLEDAASDVRDKVGQALRQLPQDIDAPPIISKADANSDFIIILGVQSSTKGALELSDYAANNLAEKLQTIAEVADVRVLGEKKYGMRIWANLEKLNATGLTITDINTAINTENVELPAGKITGNLTELSVRTVGRLNTEEEYRNLIIRDDENGAIRLGDVAEINLGPEFEENTFRLSGRNNVALAIVPQPGANYIKIADEFYKRLDDIRANADEGTVLNVVYDTTQNVRKAIEEVKETLFIAVGLVVLVIFLFFRNWSMAFRPLIDIPVSLIGTFFIMYLAGFSMNVLTLLAIVLATGLVVDDGIVVTENIYRKKEQGMPIVQAAIEGSKEIFFAVISTSIALAVVFLPVIFLEGFVGSLFREFGVVVAGAVLISSFVSLTITPVLNILLNRKNSKPSKFYVRTEPFFKGMEQGYNNMLTKFMKVRGMAWVIVGVCFAMILLIGSTLKSELAPLEDRGSIRFSFTAPEGTSFDYMDKFVDGASMYMLDSTPEAQFVFASTNNPFFGTGNPNNGFGRMILKPANERDRKQKDIVADLNKKVLRFSEGKIFLIEEQTISVGLGGRGSLPVQFVIQNQDYNKIAEALPNFLSEARKSSVFQVVDANLKFNRPEILLTINRTKARDFGLSVAAVSEVLQSALSGRRAGYFLMNGRQYQVIVQVDRENRDDPMDLERLFVRNNRNENIPLSSVIEMEETSSPPSLFTYNRFKSATISASLAPGKTIGDGVDEMRRISGDVLSSDFQTSLTGPSRDFEESSGNTLFSFVLALILVYLVLAAQFESFADPLIILITVPLAIAGAVLSLWLFGQTLNIFSQIGMIMLIGLVTKNGILIVEFANQKRDQGMGKMEAVLEASTQRLRPILMTSFATALGALPIALALGAGATSRIPLGIVIVGGIMFSLILTLFVIPAIYTFLNRHKQVQNNELEENNS